MSQSRRGILLGALFLLAFSVPVCAAIYYSDTWGGTKPQLQESGVEEDARDELFPDAISVRHSGSRLKIGHQPFLQPDGKSDLLIIAWLKPFELPSGDSKIIVAAKFDGKAKARPGYALALQRISDKIRPAVYWRNPEGQGGWYTFSEVEILPRSWFMFALSFYDQHKLGLHIIHPKLSGGFEARLAGGYEFEQPIYPLNDKPLEIGAIDDTNYRGKVGPIGIFSMKGLRDRLAEILDGFSQAKSSIPSAIKHEEVSFFTPDDQIDMGVNKVTIEAIKIGKRKGGKQ